MPGEEIMSREAMQIALDALEANLGNWAAKRKAVEVLHQALETEQKPVAWASSLDFDDDDQEIIPAKDKGKLGTSNCDIPLYTSPQKQWAGLTDDEMEALFLNEDGVRFARYIESRLKDKNA